MTFLRWLFCKHPNMQFVRNLYGDEINRASVYTVYRSLWHCPDCEMWEYRPALHSPRPAPTSRRPQD